MRLNSLTVVVVLVLAGSSAHSQQHSSKQTTYRSPDGSLVALVRSMNATNESEVRVQTSSGKVLALRDYRSDDGEHGYGITNAQWTPDSQFFVFSLGSSGGHQPWHSPVDYFSRKDRRVASLDDALNDAVAYPQFSVKAPNIVTVDLFFAKKTVTIALSSMALKHGRTK